LYRVVLLDTLLRSVMTTQTACMKKSVFGEHIYALNNWHLTLCGALCFEYIFQLVF